MNASDWQPAATYAEVIARSAARFGGREVTQPDLSAQLAIARQAEAATEQAAKDRAEGKPEKGLLF